MLRNLMEIMFFCHKILLNLKIMKCLQLCSNLYNLGKIINTFFNKYAYVTFYASESQEKNKELICYKMPNKLKIFSKLLFDKLKMI